MPALDSPEILWFLIGLLIVGCTLGCLRVIGYEYANAVAWHDLRVRVHELRLEQKTRLAACQQSKPGFGKGEEQASTEFVEGQEVEDDAVAMPSLSVPTPPPPSGSTRPPAPASTKPPVAVEVGEPPLAAAA